MFVIHKDTVLYCIWLAKNIVLILIMYVLEKPKKKKDEECKIRQEQRHKKIVNVTNILNVTTFLKFVRLVKDYEIDISNRTLKRTNLKEKYI